MAQWPRRLPGMLRRTERLAMTRVTSENPPPKVSES
jgi:hypothetical protein